MESESEIKKLISKYQNKIEIIRDLSQYGYGDIVSIECYQAFISDLEKIEEKNTQLFGVYNEDDIVVAVHKTASGDGTNCAIWNDMSDGDDFHIDNITINI